MLLQVKAPIEDTRLLVLQSEMYNSPQCREGLCEVATDFRVNIKGAAPKKIL